jgi:DNA mismatch repair protein MutL
VGKIVLLDQLTIDKIAAGEVVESPTSCLKELIENAIDAGSTELIITLERGGRQKIEVRDNGVGMSYEDLKLSITRHATSKIRTIDDLEELQTLGFRGEALAAIASVSKLSIHSAVGNNAINPSSILLLEGGQAPLLQTSKRAQGTTVTVQELFYNVPARRKFLKPPSKETIDSLRVVHAHALANPHVGFELYIDGQQEVKLLPSSLAERIEELFRIPRKSLLPLQIEAQNFERGASVTPYSVSGFLFPADSQRSTRFGQFLSVNKRPIQALSLSYAIKAGYGPTIDKEKHPLFVIDITLDTKSVDVNIHPQKKEVRFSCEEQLKEQVQLSVAQALFTTIPSSQRCMGSNPFFETTNRQNPVEGEQAEGKQVQGEQVQATRAPILLEKELPLSRYPSSFELPPLERGETTVQQELSYRNLSHLSQEGDFSIFRVGGQWAKQVGEPSGKDVLIVVDMRAVLDTIGFDTTTPKTQASQTLLRPHLLKLSDMELKVLESKLQELEKLGYRLNQFGPKSFLVEATPYDISLQEVETDIREILDEEKKTSRLPPLLKRASEREALLIRFLDKGFILRSCKILNEEVLLKILKGS